MIEPLVIGFSIGLIIGYILALAICKFSDK